MRPCVSRELDDDRRLAIAARKLWQDVRVGDQQVAVANDETGATESEARIVDCVVGTDRRNRVFGVGDDVDQAAVSGQGRKKT
jgi:hypothetical protein